VVPLSEIQRKKFITALGKIPNRSLPRVLDEINKHIHRAKLDAARDLDAKGWTTSIGELELSRIPRMGLRAAQFT
jgi:hypothetical protein